MKKILIILLLILITSCEKDRCEDKIIELTERYENYFRQAQGNEQQLALLMREYNQKLQTICD